VVALQNKRACLQRTHTREIFVVYANALSLFESICLFYKTSLLACNHFQIGGGVDNSILWLSFAQQKEPIDIFISKDLFVTFYSPMDRPMIL
jgi:hypothetical protein